MSFSGGVSDLEAEYTGNLSNSVKLSWKVCQNENSTEFIAPTKNISRRYLHFTFRFILFWKKNTQLIFLPIIQ